MGLPIIWPYLSYISYFSEYFSEYFSYYSAADVLMESCGRSSSNFARLIRAHGMGKGGNLRDSCNGRAYGFFTLNRPP